MTTDPTQAPSASARTAPRIPAAALCLAAMLPLADAYGMIGWRWGAILATPLLAGYFALCWRRLMVNARVLLLVCLALGASLLFRENGMETLVQALGRMTFLPAFIGALGLLRAAADASPTAAQAGELLVHQPPGRRYAALTVGGHIFGILLNIGGLALLLDMTKRANTLEAGFGDPHVVALRERRMTLAVMRGFSCIACWSPLGLAMNLLLASAPSVAWADIAPYGLMAAVGFMTLGLVFDFLEGPRATRPQAPRANGQGVRALLKMVGHIIALSGLALTAELLTRLPFQAILVNLVPLYALGWLLANAISRGEARPLAFAGRALRDGGIARWPNYVNEIAIFAASGLLGVILADLAPREALQQAITAAALPPGVVAAGLALTVIALGFAGINPMISASILAATMASIEVPGLSHETAVLALAGGWTCVIGVAPMMSSLVMAAAVMGRRSWEVGVKWNGRFAATASLLWALVLLVVRI